jgi:hypothetical protein
VSRFILPVRLILVFVGIRWIGKMHRGLRGVVVGVAVVVIIFITITGDIIIILIIATISSHTSTDSQFTSSTRHPLSLVCFKHSPMQLLKTFPNNAFEIFRLLALFGNTIIIIVIILIITITTTHTTAPPFDIPPHSTFRTFLKELPTPLLKQSQLLKNDQPLTMQCKTLLLVTSANAITRCSSVGRGC